jgi:hypothetical protein
MMRCIPALALALALALPSLAGAMELGYRCPATFTDDDGSVLSLVGRTTGVWRVDDAIPFVLGSGRFWRFVCAYTAPGLTEVEASVHWVELPDTEGREVLTGLCGQDNVTPAADGDETLVSPTHQARVRVDAPSSTARRGLAAALLTAAEGKAVYCPEVGPPGCSRWQSTEFHDHGTHSCTWDLLDETEGFYFSYTLRCQVEGEEQATIRRAIRMGVDLYRLLSQRTQNGGFFVFQGDWTSESFVGVAGRRSRDGELSQTVRFEATCLQQGQVAPVD